MFQYQKAWALASSILSKTYLPNSINPLLIQGSIDAGYAILTAAGLSFLGLGAQHPEVEWGLLITQSVLSSLINGGGFFLGFYNFNSLFI